MKTKIISSKLKAALEMPLLSAEERQKSVILLGLHEAAFGNNLDEIRRDENLSGVEIWTLNDWHNAFSCLREPCFNFTRVFQIHKNFKKLLSVDGWKDINKDFIIACNYCNVEVVQQCEIPGINNQMRYPEECFDVFPPEWFVSSMSYMLALAYLEGYKNIYLRRIRVGTTDEQYTGQQRQLCYAITWLEKQGIKIDAPFRTVWEEETPKFFWNNLKSVKTKYGESEEVAEFDKKKLNNFIMYGQDIDVQPINGQRLRL